MSYKNPLWLRIILYLGVIFVSVMTLSFPYFIYDEINKARYPLIIFFSFGTIFFIYFTYLGLRLWKYIRAEIILTEDSIQVIIGKRTYNYLWEQVGKIKNSVRFQLYSIYDINKQPIFIVDHQIPRFDELKTFTEECIKKKNKNIPL